MCEQVLKLNIGCGRIRIPDHIGIDIVQIIDGNGNACVDIIRDVSKIGLPFCDDSCDHIVVDNVLEHISDLKLLLNECWRVLKVDGILEGIVPLAGTDGAFRDPTHVRFFTESTFDYFCGSNIAFPNQPQKPKYARYYFLPWIKIEVARPESNGNIKFKITPRKI